MGRYYNGDINGKFWFAIQSSDDAEQFGAIPHEPGYISYVADDLETVKKRLHEIFDELKIPPLMLDIESVPGDETKFYDEYREYLKKHGSSDVINGLWASLNIGLKIYFCVKTEGYCSFEAEI